MTLTLRARLAVIWTIVFGLLFCLVSLISYTTLKRWLEDDVNLRLTELTNGLHGYLHEDGDTIIVQYDASDNEEATFIHEATRYYQIYDAADGGLVVESPGLSPLGLRLTPEEVRSFYSAQKPVDITTDFGRLRISNSEITGNDRRYLLQVGISLASMDSALKHYRDILLWRVPLAMLGAVLVAWWLSGFALRPLARVAAAARAVDVRTLERRVPVRGASDELDDVARALNDVLSRLEASVDEMRQFSSALAHELRTPLTAMRGEMELALRTLPAHESRLQGSLASQIEEIDTLRALIDSILTLARAESGQIPLVFASVDIGALASSLVEQLAPVAEARQITLRIQSEGPVLVEGDAGWLERLILNLIDNAIKFTPDGGDVLVRIARSDHTGTIEVRDSGIGMTPEVAARVFERFFRADPARSSGSGSGLGLTLVEWIVARHRGSIAVESSPGAGSTFIVTLPARATRDADSRVEATGTGSRPSAAAL